MSAVTDEIDRIVAQVQSFGYEDQLRETAAEFRQIHGDYFARGAGPSGAPWAEWYYRAADAPPDHQTLIVTGRLRDSVTQQGGENIEEVESTSLVWGTAVPYAYQNNEGGLYPVDTTLIGRHGQVMHPGQIINIPQREFVGITAGEVDVIADRIGESIIARINAGDSP